MFEYFNVFGHLLWPVLLMAAIGYGLLWYVLPAGVRITFVRELGSFFYSPVAFVCVVTFLFFANLLCFWFGRFFDAQDASLQGLFTFFPWILMVVAPAVGMRLWAEEHRQGTIELLLTMPFAPWQAIVGKFLAACTVILAALMLTFPAVWTITWLGDPDPGPILTGYIGSFLLGVSGLAITSAVSAFTRSQVVALLISIFLCFVMTVLGFPPVTDFLRSWNPVFAEWAAALGSFTHYQELTKGIVNLRDLFFFLTLIAFCLFTTAVVLRVKRA